MTYITFSDHKGGGMDLGQPEVNNLLYQAPYRICASKAAVFCYHCVIGGIGIFSLFVANALYTSDLHLFDTTLTFYLAVSSALYFAASVYLQSYDIHVFEAYILGPPGGYAPTGQSSYDFNTLQLLPAHLLLGRVLQRMKDSGGNTFYIWMFLYQGQNKRMLEHFLSEFEPTVI